MNLFLILTFVTHGPYDVPVFLETDPLLSLEGEPLLGEPRLGMTVADYLYHCTGRFITKN